MAIELRAGDKSRYGGKGVMQAVEHVNTEICEVVIGVDATEQAFVDQTLLDLDNDGTKDLVIKTTFCMKGVPSDSLYVFPADSHVVEQLSWQDMAPL